jgi:hypothetical protein
VGRGGHGGGGIIGSVREEMARDQRRWDEEMASVRRAREIHDLASKCRLRLARLHAHRARQTDGEGSNAVDVGWGDTLRRLQAKDGGTAMSSRGRIV